MKNKSISIECYYKGSKGVLLGSIQPTGLYYYTFIPDEKTPLFNDLPYGIDGISIGVYFPKIYDFNGNLIEKINP